MYKQVKIARLRGMSNEDLAEEIQSLAAEGVIWLKMHEKAYGRGSQNRRSRVALLELRRAIETVRDRMLGR